MKRNVTAGDCLGLALEVIGRGNEFGVAKRKPRLLTSYELEFLNNDLAILGMRYKRMHEMLKFFYKSWADRTDTDGWIITGEEAQLDRYLSETLEFQESMLEQEAPSLACKLLEAHPELATAMGIDEIELADAHMMSKASQQMCLLLANGNVSAHSVDEPSVPLAEPYPHAVIEELAEKTDVRKPNPCVLEQRIEETPQDEFALIAKEVASAVASGTKPSEIFIATPNGTWSKCIAKALKAASIKSAQRVSDCALHGDLASLDDSTAAQAACLLTLVASPEDAASWRSWCGFGRHLAHNDFFDELWRYGRNNELGMLESLQKLHNEGRGELKVSDSAFAEVMSRYTDAKRAISICTSLTGSKLIESVCQLVAYDERACEKAQEALIELLGSTDLSGKSAQELSICIRKRLEQRPWEDAEAVRIGRIEDVYGLEPKLAIISGMVNGFTPNGKTIDATQTMLDKRERIEQAEADKITYLRNHCTGKVIASGFKLIEARLAEQFKLGVERIQIIDSQRVARVTPSSVLKKL